jgi:hypothetical protein
MAFPREQTGKARSAAIADCPKFSEFAVQKAKENE